MDQEMSQRMEVINKMLLEMASGNFHYRIERTPSNDNIEALVVTLNMLAEEIQGTMAHQGYVNADTTFLDIVQMSLLVESNGKIQMVNQQTCSMLSSLYEDLVGQEFVSILTPASALQWKALWEKLHKKEIVDASIALIFKTKGSLVIPKTAYVTSFAETNVNKNKTLITVIHHTTVQNEMDADLRNQVIEQGSPQKNLSSSLQKEAPKPKLRLSYEDIRKIRDAHDMIINNLEQDFPSLRKFALQIGTNEFKLKYGFKELYGTTVHRFLANERLRKAKMMIQFSDLSIKSIAFMTGFKSVQHFSRTFKKRYEFAPTELRKNSLNQRKET